MIHDFIHINLQIENTVPNTSEKFKRPVIPYIFSYSSFK
jgi:hypothetical protein